MPFQKYPKDFFHSTVFTSIINTLDHILKFFLFIFLFMIFSGIREKLAHANPPRCFRGIAVALVTGGLLSLAFMGFSGLVKLPY